MSKPNKFKVGNTVVLYNTLGEATLGEVVLIEDGLTHIKWDDTGITPHSPRDLRNVTLYKEPTLAKSQKQVNNFSNRGKKNGEFL